MAGYVPASNEKRFFVDSGSFFTPPLAARVLRCILSVFIITGLYEKTPKYYDFSKKKKKKTEKMLALHLNITKFVTFNYSHSL